MSWHDKIIRVQEVVQIGPRMRVAAMQARRPFDPAHEQTVYDTFMDSPGNYLLAMSPKHLCADDWDTARLLNAPDGREQEFLRLEQELLQYEHKPSVTAPKTVVAKRCRLCGHEMTLPGGRQLRAGDEGMTAIYRCSNKNCSNA
jgi:DNA-directed RNA polymerase subunit M/transcription elongation factor TFIIS